MPSSEPVIELVDVSLIYPGPPPVEAVKHCDLRINAGEHVSIVGHSGSGKSTLLNVIGLLDRPTDGSVNLLGKDTTHLPDIDRTSLRGKHIGFVFQDFQLLPHLTAVENVELSLIYRGAEYRDKRTPALEALSRVGLDHRLHSRPTMLSGGEKQRVAIARALVAQPDIVLCDEPTGNLDSTNTANIMALLREINEQGQTIVTITHEREVAEQTAKLFTMSDGVLRV